MASFEGIIWLMVENFKEVGQARLVSFSACQPVSLSACQPVSLSGGQPASQPRPSITYMDTKSNTAPRCNMEKESTKLLPKIYCTP